MSYNNKEAMASTEFSRNCTTTKISLTLPDEEGEESYRRVAGNPSVVYPSFSSTIDSVYSTSSTQTGKQTTKSWGQQKFRWTLKEVPMLPEFYPLEKTAVFVPHTSPSEISERISDALRELSIDASYVNKKAQVRCVSIDGVNFRIFLYRGRRQYSSGIIVEVQRHFGNSFNFYSIANAILEAARGKTKPIPNSRSDLLPVVLDKNDNFNVSIRSSLKIVSKMLNHPAFDAQHLALQNLDFLTDPSKVEINTARNISKEIMQPGNAIGNKVTGIILTDQVVLEKTKNYSSLRPIAMNILSNVLQVILADNIQNDILQGLVLVLQEDLMNAESNPRIAYIAAKCVKHLIIIHEEVRAVFESALEFAAQVGYSKHTLLMNEAKCSLQKWHVHKCEDSTTEEKDNGR